MAPILAVLAAASFTAVLGLRAGHYVTVPEAPIVARSAPVGAPLVSIELAGRDFLIPVVGVRARDLRDHFDDKRGRRSHKAIDIMAPRGTPVVAVANGRVARLSRNPAGGIGIYQYDPEEKIAYYYAHLDRYAEGLAEGQVLKQGSVIGFVGSTGNAPEGAPHLHFAIYKLTAAKLWWKGEAINPYPLLAGR